MIINCISYVMSCNSPIGRALTVVFLLGFTAGIILMGIKISSDTNKSNFVHTTCVLTGCNQSSSLCNGDLCYVTTLNFAWTENPEVTSRQENTDDASFNVPPCPTLDSIVQCYYRNIDDIETTLTLNQENLENDTVVNDWFAMVFLLMGFLMASSIAILLYHRRTEYSQRCDLL